MAGLGPLLATFGPLLADVGALLARLGPLLPLHGVIWGIYLLTRIGSLLAHPVPAVPHLEPPLSRHKESLASSWSLSWPPLAPTSDFPFRSSERLYDQL